MATYAFVTEWRRSLVAYILFLVVFQGAVIAIADLKRPHWGDEDHFIQTIRRFGSDTSLHTLKHYNEMSTPLPFVAYAAWGWLVGFETHQLRLLSVLIALLTYLTFHRFLYVVSGNARMTLLTAVFLTVHPYMAGLSIFVFTDMLPILFLILACLAVVRRNAIGLGLALAGTLLCRQYYIFLVISVILFCALEWLNLRNSASSRKRATLSMLPASVMSLIPLGLLVLFWGGVSPDNEMKRLYLAEGFSFHPNALTLYIALLLVYLLPIVVFRWKRIYCHWRILAASAAGSLWYWLFPVAPSKYAVAIDVHTVGLFHRFLQWCSSSEVFQHLVF
ncbi:MAG TPA: hypothetical protein VN285_06930, partial [Candidatus Deferrimicrobium sp.]|nr:hypothetical protein [Candidatus Deferrimicrobium sp.]